MARRPNDFLQEPIQLFHEHGSLTEDTTVKIFKVPAGRKLRIDRAIYINPTGLAADANNYFNVKVLNDSAVAFNWSTLTGAQGTIAANTFVDMVASATDANMVVGSGDVLSVFYDETGSATLPAGRIVIEGRYVV